MLSPVQHEGRQHDSNVLPTWDHQLLSRPTVLNFFQIVLPIADGREPLGDPDMIDGVDLLNRNNLADNPNR